MSSKWAREYTSNQYQRCRQRKTEIGKVKAEKRLGKVEEAKKKAFKQINGEDGGSWVMEEQTDAQLAERGTLSERCEAITVLPGYFY